jgi:hypothetical protein
MEALTMWSRRRSIVAATALAVLVAGSVACTSDTVDDGDSPDNVLEVESFEGPQATATLQGGTSGGAGQECLLTAPEWTMALRNVPKVDLAGPDSSPFNDIILDSMDVSYLWSGLPAGTIAPTGATIGLAGVTIPPDASESITFSPINTSALATDTGAPVGEPDLAGTSALVQMVIRAHTVENEHFTLPVAAVLNVQVCPPSAAVP